MTQVDTGQVRRRLQEFDFARLLIDDLGWDRHRAAPLTIPVDGSTYTLNAIAEKRGFVVYVCAPDAEGMIPATPVRRRIGKEAAKSAREHMVIFADAAHTTQMWQWVKHQADKPDAPREHVFHQGQTGEPLLQRLRGIAFGLAEEEELSIALVAGRVRQALDVERVTRRFYDRFKTEHQTFLNFIQGIQSQADREWYGSLMLNRMMFVYFIQKQGFLDGDPDYLKNRLRRMQQNGSKGRFQQFYRLFLLRLFHEGLGQPEARRAPELAALLGRVPYLNGGLFDIHDLERENPDIQIPDEAFEKVFDFFDAYNWHLDDRPLRADNEINPDVLGYIFEKYINQKQMGAYYTKEDITGYISRNTVVPYLFDAARKECPIAFAPDGGVWRLLKDDPDRYIYDAVRRGTDLPLPEEIAAGLNDVSRRTGWNRPAPAEYGLPTETWREVMARRRRYEEVRDRLASGQVRDINDLITLNLDICRFAQDVITHSEGPELVRAFWKALNCVSVLDPTCGSGAFLFAALNVLEPLYTACLEAMQGFLDDLERSGRKRHPDRLKPFRDALEQAAKHPNRRYFVLKSIVVNNLYGVDIMEEAVEICKLRLFLKLVAQVNDYREIEALPDIDFNIRAGNTLVGFTSLDAVRNAITMSKGTQHKMLLDDEIKATLARIEEDAQVADDAFVMFQLLQTEYGMDANDFTSAKQELRKRLQKLGNELDRYLVTQYGVDLDKSQEYGPWQASHRPFHWFVEFYGIMQRGGFDVIVGNPPYVEYSKVKREYTVQGYKTEACGNLYAFVIERCVDILRPAGRFGMIVQLPIVCTDRMKPLQKECLDQSDSTWFANFDDRPAKLFDGLQHIRASILTLQKGKAKTHKVYSTTYNRWYTEERQTLFGLLCFESVADYLMSGAIPKMGHPVAKQVRQRIAEFAPLGNYLITTTKHPTYFHNSPQYWIRAMTFVPYFWNERDGEQMSTQVKTLNLPTELDASVVAAALNSTLFYWWFVVLSDCRHLNLREIESFPVGLDRMTESTRNKLADLSNDLMADFNRHKQRREADYKATGMVVYDEFYPKHSKPIIDQIDRVLAQHYGFTDEELDFIINYDIKYRMGQEGADEGDGE